LCAEWFPTADVVGVIHRSIRSL